MTRKPFGPVPRPLPPSGLEEVMSTETGYRLEDLFGNRIGTLVVTGPEVAVRSPLQPNRDYWYWTAPAWPDQFRLRHNLGPRPQGQWTAEGPAVAFHGQGREHDLSDTALTVWRIDFEGRGPVMHFVRSASGHVQWFADEIPDDNHFVLEATDSLLFTRVHDRDALTRVPAIEGTEMSS